MFDHPLRKIFFDSGCELRNLASCWEEERDQRETMQPPTSRWWLGMCRPKERIELLKGNIGGEVLTSCRRAVRGTIGYFPLEWCFKPHRLGLCLDNYLKSWIRLNKKVAYPLGFQLSCVVNNSPVKFLPKFVMARHLLALSHTHSKLPRKVHVFGWVVVETKIMKRSSRIFE